MATFATLAAASLLAVDVVALTFHLSVIVLLVYNIRRRTSAFRQGFYVLFIAVSLTDWLYVMNSWIYIRFPFLGLFLDFYVNKWPLATFLAGISSYCCYFQPFGHLALAVNRFSAFYMPVLHWKLWSGRRLKCVLLLLAIAPLPFASFALRGLYSYKRMDSNEAAAYPASGDPRITAVSF
ncbi:SRV-1 protein [Aphelenchoides avenae]|nr:SRV-1 protein [Aphelenchus avenae]